MNNSTIKPKQKICVECKKPNYIFSRSMCKTCASKTYAPIKKVSDKRMKEEFSGDESRSNLISDLDRIISNYVRIKEADSSGVNICFTCGRKFHWENLDCGHYIQRSESGLRFDLQNLRPQCRRCNTLHETNTKPYTDKLEAENKGITEYLIEQSRQVTKLSMNDLKELRISMQEKLRIAQSKLKS